MKHIPDNKQENNYGDCFTYNKKNKPKGSYVDISSGPNARGAKHFKISISWKKVFSVVLFLIIGLSGASMIYLYSILNSFNYDDLSDSPDSSDMSDGDPFINDNMILNVLLLGTDTRSPNDKGRSDTILIMTLDMRHKKIKITSLLRDIWVRIPGKYSDRINTAYSLGGAKLSIETVERNFGIRIDRYASVDFDGFSKIVDNLGGIDIDLTSNEVEYINKYSGDPNKLSGSGKIHLTGLQTLHHSRNRNSLGSDYDRTNRQRHVIITILDKLKTANIAQITKIISDVGPMITTNFKTSEITKLASNAPTYLNFNLEQFRLPTNENVRNETIDHKMVLVINDMPKARYELSKFIYEEAAIPPPDETSSKSSKVKQDLKK